MAAASPDSGSGSGSGSTGTRVEALSRVIWEVVIPKAYEYVHIQHHSGFGVDCRSGESLLCVGATSMFISPSRNAPKCVHATLTVTALESGRLVSTFTTTIARSAREPSRIYCFKGDPWPAERVRLDGGLLATLALRDDTQPNAADAYQEDPSGTFELRGKDGVVVKMHHAVAAIHLKGTTSGTVISASEKALRLMRDLCYESPQSLSSLERADAETVQQAYFAALDASASTPLREALSKKVVWDCTDADARSSFLSRAFAYRYDAHPDPDGMFDLIARMCPSGNGDFSSYAIDAARTILARVPVNRKPVKPTKASAVRSFSRTRLGRVGDKVTLAGFWEHVSEIIEWTNDSVLRWYFGVTDACSSAGSFVATVRVTIRVNPGENEVVHQREFKGEYFGGRAYVHSVPGPVDQAQALAQSCPVTAEFRLDLQAPQYATADFPRYDEKLAVDSKDFALCGSGTSTVFMDGRVASHFFDLLRITADLKTKEPPKILVVDAGKEVLELLRGLCHQTPASMLQLLTVVPEVCLDALYAAHYLQAPALYSALFRRFLDDASRGYWRAEQVLGVFVDLVGAGEGPYRDRFLFVLRERFVAVDLVQALAGRPQTLAVSRVGPAPPHPPTHADGGQKRTAPERDEKDEGSPKRHCAKTSSSSS